MALHDEVPDDPDRLEHMVGSLQAARQITQADERDAKGWGALLIALDSPML
jgi:hypothetical protein